MTRRCTIESLLELGDRQSGHQHIECASAEHSIPPEKWQQILAYDEVRGLGRKSPREPLRERFVELQESALARSPELPAARLP